MLAVFQAGYFRKFGEFFFGSCRVSAIRVEFQVVTSTFNSLQGIHTMKTSLTRCQLNCEKLEQRDLMAGITMSNGTINIEGTNVRDIAVVSQNGSIINVSMAGGVSQLKSFPVSQVRGVVFHGYAGSERHAGQFNRWGRRRRRLSARW
jgi:hypothetical protein